MYNIPVLSRKVRHEKPLRYMLCIAGGIGHVRLPLGISLPKAGRRVVLYNVNSPSKLNLKIFHIPIRHKEGTYGTTNISRFRHGLLLIRMCIFAAKKIILPYCGIYSLSIF